MVSLTLTRKLRLLPLLSYIVKDVIILHRLHRESEPSWVKEGKDRHPLQDPPEREYDRPRPRRKPPFRVAKISLIRELLSQDVNQCSININHFKGHSWCVTVGVRCGSRAKWDFWIRGKGPDQSSARVRWALSPFPRSGGGWIARFLRSSFSNQ